MTPFAKLDLIPELARAVATQNYEQPTPIQARAIPPLLRGHDVLGCAQTGTGKTAAFALPILQRLHTRPGSGATKARRIRALVLTPTRELASQIAESFGVYGQFLPLTHQVIFGGVKERPQIAALRRGTDILVATPGRLLDLHGRGFIDLGGVEFFVLDEADRMLDMGFIGDIKRVMAHLPKKRQNVLFSATMPPTIAKLAQSFLVQPKRIDVAPQSTTVDLIAQQLMHVDRPDKKHLLLALLQESDVSRAIVFTRTRHGANRLATRLTKKNVSAAAIHGDKTQNARERAIAGFRGGNVRVLVATDVASRGIDIDDVSHVINFDLPNEPESYVHRIGRTGRAGRDGVAISFCDATERDKLRAIEQVLGQSIPVISSHPYPLDEDLVKEAAKPPAAMPQRKNRRRSSPSKRRHPRGNAAAAKPAP